MKRIIVFVADFPDVAYNEMRGVIISELQRLTKLCLVNEATKRCRNYAKQQDVANLIGIDRTHLSKYLRNLIKKEKSIGE